MSMDIVWVVVIGWCVIRFLSDAADIRRMRQIRVERARVEALDAVIRIDPRYL